MYYYPVSRHAIFETYSQRLAANVRPPIPDYHLVRFKFYVAPKIGLMNISVWTLMMKIRDVRYWEDDEVWMVAL